MKSIKKFLIILMMFVVFSAAFAVTADAAETEYKTYTDKKFGYSIEYPDIFKESEQYEDGDGNSNFVLTTDEYDLTVLGGKNDGAYDGNALLKEATNIEEDDFGYVYGVEALPDTARSGADFYTLKYVTDRPGPEAIAHVYGVVNKNVKAVFEFRYSQSDKEQFKEMIAHMEKSLKLK